MNYLILKTVNHIKHQISCSLSTWNTRRHHLNFDCGQGMTNLRYVKKLTKTRQRGKVTGNVSLWPGNIYYLLRKWTFYSFLSRSSSPPHYFLWLSRTHLKDMMTIYNLKIQQQGNLFRKSRKKLHTLSISIYLITTHNN